MGKTIPLDDLIGTSEAARMLHVSQGWIRALVARGELPGIKTAIGVVVPRQAVEALAARRRAAKEA